VDAPKVVEQLIVLLSDTIQPCYQHHLLPTLDIVNSTADSIIHSRVYPKGKSPTGSCVRWESVLTRGILAGLSVSRIIPLIFQRATDYYHRNTWTRWNNSTKVGSSVYLFHQ